MHLYAPLRALRFSATGLIIWCFTERRNLCTPLNCFVNQSRTWTAQPLFKLRRQSVALLQACGTRGAYLQHILVGTCASHGLVRSSILLRRLSLPRSQPLSCVFLRVGPVSQRSYVRVRICCQVNGRFLQCEASVAKNVCLYAVFLIWLLRKSNSRASSSFLAFSCAAWSRAPCLQLVPLSLR